MVPHDCLSLCILSFYASYCCCYFRLHHCGYERGKLGFLNWQTFGFEDTWHARPVVSALRSASLHDNAIGASSFSGKENRSFHAAKLSSEQFSKLFFL